MGEKKRRAQAGFFSETATMAGSLWAAIRATPARLRRRGYRIAEHQPDSSRNYRNEGRRKKTPRPGWTYRAARRNKQLRGVEL